jgi:hypothetical protein
MIALFFSNGIGIAYIINPTSSAITFPQNGSADGLGLRVKKRLVVEFQFFFFRGNQPASQAMPPTRAKIPKTKAQSRRANGKLMVI